MDYNRDAIANAERRQADVGRSAVRILIMDLDGIVNAVEGQLCWISAV